MSMSKEIRRREFLQIAAGCAVCLQSMNGTCQAASSGPIQIISPGCVRTRVKVAKLYLGIPKAHWPTPALDLEAEMRRYEAEIAGMKSSFSDIEFTISRLMTKPEEIAEIAGILAQADGVLAIHLSMGITPILGELLKVHKPTMLFAAPYSGHEWTSFGPLRTKPEGALLDFILSSNLGDLAAAVRPIRAIHHLREAKIVNVSTKQPSADYLTAVSRRFGTEIKTIPAQPVIDAYNAVNPAEAESEAKRWISQAEKVVEPPRDEILRSCRLALAFERILAQEDATCLTVDCYGSMYRNLPAFPCVGFVRLNNMGLGGICESDLTSALTHILAQGLTGKPAFISDPTMDMSVSGIILAHCLGSTKMDGPDGEAAPFRLRTIMERQEGCVPQVRMRQGQKVTQLRLIDADSVFYFTGDIIQTPDSERGCRTQITVKIDGDAEKLWQNWSHGLHRSTVYGDITEDLKRFCRFKDLKLIHEA
jgi:hypothetical protein